ncbi:tetratricopeptide repeat protein [bacterium SCSIO 12643]|nr:tetratricopeptide repeat protein [bacterium SCSIO 12643]
MNILLKATLFIYFLILSNPSFSQTSKYNLDDVNHFLELAESYRISQPDSCLYYSEKAAQISSKYKYPLQLVKSYLLLANYHWRRTEYKEALQYAHDAQKRSRDLDNKEQLAHANLLIANIYLELGDYDQKIDLIFDALEIFKRSGNKKGISYAYISISAAYFKQNNMDKAFEYAFNSLETSKKIKDLNGTARALNNIGVMYGTLKNYKQEQSYYLKSIAIAQQMHDELREGVLYLNIGKTLYNLNALDSSYQYIKQAQLIFENTKNDKYLAEIHIQLAYNYLKSLQYDLGIQNAQIAFNLGEKHRLVNTMADAAKVSQLLYEASNDVAQAYQYAKIHFNLQDSLNLQSINSQVAQIEMKYEVEHALLKKEAEQKHKQSSYVMIFTIVVAIMCLVVIGIYYSSKIKITQTIQERIELEFELETKHKELVSNTMSLLKTNKTLTEITNNLNEVLNYDNLYETQLAVNAIANSVKQATRSNVWKEFEMRFQQVHHKFNENLLSKFPNLTPSELRLCALLRLNLTTKEISELTGQRTSSLEIARSRLRKKLGITDRNINLVVFLSAF